MNDLAEKVRAELMRYEHPLFVFGARPAAEGVEALVLGTGWPEFRGLDFARIKNLLRRPLIVDTKNILDSVRLRAMGFEYVGVGRV